MKFEFKEDEEFFVNFLTGGDKLKLAKEFSQFFDFRDPSIKRGELNSLRKNLLPILMERDKNTCQLRLAGCTNSEFQIDHIVPLSSNKLNVFIRGMKMVGGKKAKTQSFGSNNIKNLVLACKSCNAVKKHRLFNPKTKDLF